MKFAIFGVSGTGKTYYSNLLSKELSIPSYHMDDIEVEFMKRRGVSKFHVDEFQSAILRVLNGSKWIIEGTDVVLSPLILQNADYVLLVQPHNIFAPIINGWRRDRNVYGIGFLKSVFYRISWLIEYPQKYRLFKKECSKYNKRIVRVTDQEGLLEFAREHLNG
jgi:hypothetical protein